MGHPLPLLDRATRAAPFLRGRGPVTEPGGNTLKAIFVGLCALVLVTQASAATKHESNVQPKSQAKPVHVGAMSMKDRLAHKVKIAKKVRSTVRFFEKRRWLLSSPEHRATAAKALQQARRTLARVTRTIAAIRRVFERREARRRAELSPRWVICDVFGQRYCSQAVAVATCESRLTTTAQNGQYLGLFQMGSHERRTFGHGGSARQQARAAYRYFVRSGRDWSPWSCKPWYAY